ncbi:MAG: hypothetical protein K2N60_08620 [Oscillospiraceae bacterium]|nr:hypothetical protein [Oscillospiraceae bacterium]
MIKMEGKSHRTKKELAQREAAESALSTGLPLKVRSEVRNNKAAFKEFKRVSTLLKIIDKNDALVENVINRYCQITAEILDFEVKREEFSHGIEQLQVAHDDDVAAHPNIEERVLSDMEYFNTLAKMESNLLALDKRIQDKRKMLLDIEKENIMTIAAQLRSIPKKDEDEADDDPMAKLFEERGA